ncbi:RHS repeat-associated core domain-containing protein [Pseudomonas silesiensis]|uniref:RHS repeat-associated core domain-containing protein n=1 Tax=Pseudomonas silesiensis TaxID=1853130 RepID=UPI0030DCDFE2
MRHDDPAGSRWLPEYGLTGAVLAEDRHFLDSLEPPDWPVTEAERDPLLEPGDGSRSVWHFAASGEALRQTDAKGHIRHFTHDRAGQLHDIRLQRAGLSSVETLVSAIEYTASGQVLQELAGNGMRTRSSYDPANGQLLSLANQAPDGDFLQNLSYRYDPVGNITAISDAALPIQYFANQRIEPVRYFTYDTLYQLIEATGWESAKPSLGPELPEWQAFGPPDSSRWCNYSETYHYDEAGNLLQRVHQGAMDDTLTMQVALHSNRSIQERPGANLDESFDARGNLLELQPGQMLQWNGRNELAEVTQVARSEGTDDLERYVYDGEGTRLRKWRTAVAKSVTHAAEVRYLPGIELHTNSASGERLQVVSVQAGRCSVRLLHWNSPPPNGVENDQLRYCFDDHLGSSAFEVDGQAKPISQEVYYPFGGTAWLAGRHEVETSYKTIRYSGKERDISGLYYYGERYYAPWLQRWLNSDPAGEVDGLNFYRFVKNSPVIFVDQKGQRSILAWINDFLLERNLDEGVVVQQRGMKAIKKVFPELGSSIVAALASLIEELEFVVAMLGAGNFDGDLANNYFGAVSTEDIDYLLKGYEEVLVNAKKIMLKPEKIVAFSFPDGAKTPNAFTFPHDKRKKIYVNSNSMRDATPHIISHVLKHELTHQSGAFMSEDFWYLSLELSSLSGGTMMSEMDPAVLDRMQDIIMEAKSRNFMDGVVAEKDINASVKNAFVSATNGNGISEAIAIFKNDPALRTSMALLNADTLAAFASALNKSGKLSTA